MVLICKTKYFNGDTLIHPGHRVEVGDEIYGKLADTHDWKMHYDVVGELKVISTDVEPDAEPEKKKAGRPRKVMQNAFVDHGAQVDKKAVVKNALEIPKDEG